VAGQGTGTVVDSLARVDTTWLSSGSSCLLYFRSLRRRGQGPDQVPPSDARLCYDCHLMSMYHFINLMATNFKVEAEPPRQHSSCRRKFDRRPRRGCSGFKRHPTRATFGTSFRQDTLLSMRQLQKGSQRNVTSGCGPGLSRSESSVPLGA
jgi:hypothetical protein